MANRPIDLPETRGTFKIKGVVNGTQKDKFFEEKETRSGKPFRNLNFGIEYYTGKSAYMNIMGFTRDKVYFYKRPEKGEKKGETKAVPWSERNTFNEKGFNLLGINVGVQKILDKNGNAVNDKKHLVEYDAAKLIADNLKDGDSVFVRGNIGYSHYNSNNGDVRRSVKYEPNQVSLCSTCDFDADDYKEINQFTQTIVFMGIEKEKDINGKETGRFEVSAKIVNYNTIEDTVFYINDTDSGKALANIMRKKLKPYTSIKVWGNIEAVTQTETVTEEDEIWGMPNQMESVSAPTKREMIITGADPATIDTDTYNKDAMEEAMNSIKESESAKASYGSFSNDVKNDSEDDVWGDNAIEDSLDSEDEAWL